MEQNYTFFPEINDYTNFELFLKFLGTAEPEIPNASNLRASMEYKAKALFIVYQETLNQIKKCHIEYEEIEKRGYGSSIHNTILKIEYMKYLNYIYSLCENLSYLVKKWNPEAKLKKGFNEQKMQYLTSKKTIDEFYSNLLEKAYWYDEIHLIRTEATHYLNGFIFISHSKEPGYLIKKIYNQRKATPTKITIDEQVIMESIEDNIKKINEDFNLFLDNYSKHFRELKFNKEIPVSEICLLTSERIEGYRSIALNDYINKKPRKCKETLPNCPRKLKCNLLKRSIEREEI